MRHPYLWASALLLALGFGGSAQLQRIAWAQTPSEVEATIRTAALEQGADPVQLVRVARCEGDSRGEAEARRRIGGPPGRLFDPYAVGAAGEQGVFQLLPGGSMAQLFRQWGYTNVWDVEQQAEFAARAFVAGHARAWSCR